MLKKTITYEGFDGEEVSEVHYFHLTEAELAEIELSHKGGLSEMMKRVIAAEDGNTIMQEIKKMILMSYGVRSPDGKKFIKNQELRDDFVGTGAYSALFMLLVTDADAAAEFIKGVIPAKLAEKVSQLDAANRKSNAAAILTKVPVPQPDVITKAEMLDMSQEDLQPVWERVRAGELIIGD